MSNSYEAYSRKFRVPAVYVILLRDKKVFMIKRSNTGWMDGKYTLPSGHVEAGETFLHAAVRETKEEAGVAIKTEDLKFVHLSERDLDNGKIWDDVYFICADFSGEPINAEPEKHSDPRWFDYQELPEDLMIPPVYEVLKQIKNGSQYSALFAK